MRGVVLLITCVFISCNRDIVKIRKEVLGLWHINRIEGIDTLNIVDKSLWFENNRICWLPHFIEDGAQSLQRYNFVEKNDDTYIQFEGTQRLSGSYRVIFKHGTNRIEDTLLLKSSDIYMSFYRLD